MKKQRQVFRRDVRCGMQPLVGPLWLVLVLHRKVEVSVCGRETSVPLCYASGMVGALPVFATLDEAEAFADGKYSVHRIEAMPDAQLSER